MKKTLLVALLLAVAIGVFATGVAFAQEPQPPAQPFGSGFGGGMMGGGRGRGMIAGGQAGPMHTYVVNAFSAKVGLSVEQVNELLQSGKTMYQIALDQGVAEADIPALLTEVHTTAFEKAVASGAITQEQADWMSQRMAQRQADGYGFGNCGGTGQPVGAGMMRGGHWQQQTNP
ncbi:MAG: hypothetical protein KKC71_00855 [Chloroflexi bacterium]|nr:hypothetical protein [Chloroflexota bacterium]